MAITHRTYVLITFPLCCVSIALLATSLSTQYWLQAKAYYDDPSFSPSDVNYGLFTGKLTRRILLTPKVFELHMTCLPDVSICSLSCLGSPEEREEETRSLYESNGTISVAECDPIGLLSEDAAYKIEQISKLDHSDHLQINLLPRNAMAKFASNPQFINMGVWGATIAFLALSLLLATIGAVFAVINTAGNPVEPILGILGLFIWNASAVFCICMVLILWGCHFGIDLVSNAALAETITGQTSTDGQAALGFSYWILLGAEVAHWVNIGLLIYRRHLIRTEPPPPTIELKEDPDGAIFLY